ncbi:PHP domain-containing protein [Anaerosinus massiliensis]|uniref:PHP domain-containing protein n=1 Tax=Massilibacillus massiliensis TaxID=1806837 RepID=UPI000DA609DA|nr:PHP domain-containing protein [Massilibacillus massiliensis]
MKLTADYHTHTKYSHGVGTIEENVISALEKGLSCIAITEHGPAAPYGIQPSVYKHMRETVKILQDKYRGKVKILLGMEANIIDEKGNLDVEDWVLNDCDILLAGFHFDIVYSENLQKIRQKLSRRQSIKAKLDESLYQEIVARNTVAMVQALQNYSIDIITHPGDQQPIDIVKIADAAIKQKAALEINNFHRRLNAVQLKMIENFSAVRFVINSDAHRPQDVGKITGALKILQEVNLDLNRIENLHTNDDK